MVFTVVPGIVLFCTIVTAGTAAGRASPTATREELLSVETLRPWKWTGVTPPPIVAGGRIGSSARSRPAGDGGRGWRGRLTQALPGRGRGGEVRPRENEGTSGGIPPPLVEGAAPGTQDACRAAKYGALMGLQRGFTQARSQLGNRALLAVRVDSS